MIVLTKVVLCNAAASRGFRLKIIQPEDEDALRFRKNLQGITPTLRIPRQPTHFSVSVAGNPPEKVILMQVRIDRGDTNRPEAKGPRERDQFILELN